MRKNFIFRLTSKLLVLVMAVSLVLSVIPCFLVTANAASTITEQEVISKLKSAESKWADGEIYIDRLDDNVYTCFGFGRELFRYVFGADAPLSWSLSKAKFVNGTRNVKEIGHLGQNYSLNELKALLAQAKPGDLLVASNGSSNHLVVIRSASSDGSKIYVYDANWKKDKQRRPLIRTNARWTASGIREKKPTGVTLYRYINYVVDSQKNPNVQYGNWRILIPQNYKVLCYDTADALTDCTYRKPRVEAYDMFCTERAVLSDGTVRYRYTTPDNRKFWFDFTNNMSLWTAESGASTPGTKIEMITNGRWEVNIPADYKVLCYSTAGAVSNSNYRKPRTSAYNLTCTKCALLSNGITRYYYRTGNNNEYEYWFDFINSMTVRNLS